ncbi:MAG: MBL fold metallo-hydrolase [Crocinitomicaceae bacterium]|nr:MBL fold metallo-hydrolase [Crocinitomicaceae bacterium]|tara:strand:+ start:9912 stop:11282 length:1371 start_codon:yes stop_codon:yes gene_type:complete
MNDNQIKIQFLGGAGTVTGSKTLLTTDQHSLMVDCGLFQGLKNLRLKNWSELPIEESSVNDVILTHAHLDHSGYLPLLVRNGFSGKIHCTQATKKLAELILFDSAHIQEEDAEKANRLHYTAHKPAKPLYTTNDVEACLGLFEVHNYGEWIILNKDFKFVLHNAGHIAGSAWTEIRSYGRKIVFSGDLGRSKPQLLLPAHRCEEADYLVIESTYGRREHEKEDPKAELEKIINTTFQNGGNVLIPAFAVERTQEILHYLGELLVEGKIPKKKIYIDSPMAISATEIFMDFDFRRPIEKEILEILSKLVHGIRDGGASKRNVESDEQKIVIAGSGMLSGGRILNYLERHVGDSSCSIVLTGFQAEGTRGRQLLNGMPELKFFGKYHRVFANIHLLKNMSAHADQKELLLWIKRMSKKPKRIFINHGEPVSADSLRVKIQDELGIICEIAEENKDYIC